MNSRAGTGFEDAVLAALEFPAVIEAISSLATCGPGKAASSELRPLSDIGSARAEQLLVDDVGGYFQAGGELSFQGVLDIKAALGRAQKGATLSGPDLRAVADAEISLGRAHSIVETQSESGQRFGRLHALCAQREDCSRVIQRLAAALEANGEVADQASPELSKLRRQRASLHADVRERLNQLVRNPHTAKLLSEPIVTLRSGRYVVPVRAEFASLIPGVAHDQSSSGATIFIEPMTSVDANNRLRALEIAEEREVARILAELSAIVGEQASALLQNAKLTADLDSAGARARWALAVEALRPDLVEQCMVRINRGRHPLLRRQAVPLDVEVGDRWDVMIVSGPNMGGKTVVLKTIGLFCLLAYAGIPLPAAAGTTIGRFEHIACIIGDDQSIANDLSSFSAHLRALGAALEGAGPGSLVLADELGSGTEPSAGAALAQAYVETLLRVAARAVITTHYTQLKTFAASCDRVVNASMLFDPANNQPTFRLATGVPGQSLAFALARSLGLGSALVERAEQLLGDDSRNMETAFANLARDSEELRRQSAALQDQLARQGRTEAAFKARIEAVEVMRLELEQKAKAALERAIHEVRQDVLATAERSAQDAGRRRMAIRREPAAAVQRALSDIHRSLGLEGAGVPIEAPKRTLSPGDRVFVRSFGQSGTVSEVYDRDVLVNLGNMKALIARSEVLPEATSQPDAATKAGSGEDKRGRGGPATRVEGSLSSQTALTTIDVRGLRVDEALPLVDKALDEASLAALSLFRIVHGKGTGQLRRAVREFLRDHPQVSDTAFAPDPEGGTGVTVVSLR